jgi:hypothetical protein
MSAASEKLERMLARVQDDEIRKLGGVRGYVERQAATLRANIAAAVAAQMRPGWDQRCVAGLYIRLAREILNAPWPDLGDNFTGS